MPGLPEMQLPRCFPCPITPSCAAVPTASPSHCSRPLHRNLADPREAGGHYWGYITRIAPGLAQLRDGCPFPGGYDLVVGTSGAGCRGRGSVVEGGRL